MADIEFSKAKPITSDLGFMPDKVAAYEGFFPISDYAAVLNDAWTNANTYKLTIGSGNYSGRTGLAVESVGETSIGPIYGAMQGVIYGKWTYALAAAMGVSVNDVLYVVKMDIDSTHQFQSIITIKSFVSQGSSSYYTFDYREQIKITGGNDIVITQQTNLSLGMSEDQAPYYVGFVLIPIVKATSTAYYAQTIFDRYYDDFYPWVFPDTPDLSYNYRYDYPYQGATLPILQSYLPQWSDGFNSYGAIFNLDMYCREYELTFEIPDISPEAGEPSDVGGMGQGDDQPSFDNSSDSIDLPADPTVGVCNVGFVNVYKTGSQSLQNIGVELFPALSYTAPTPIASGTTTDAIVDGFNSIVTFLANIPSFFEQSVAATLINYIIDCHVIPVTPSSGSSEAIKVGYKTLNAYGYRLSNDYVTFDCGTINLSEYYASFADFLNTSKIFLPFVGFVPARPEWYLRDSLNITYKFNIIDGSFMAYIRSTGRYVNNNNSGPTIVGQYSGNACVHLPITGVTYSNMVSGLVGAGAGAVVSAGSGSIAGAATSALNAANLHGDMPSSNAYSSSGSFLSVRRPFLMIERPVSSYSKTYQREIGIPSNVSVKLSNAKGFAIVGDIHLDGITATDQEKAEIEKLLSTGVIF